MFSFLRKIVLAVLYNTGLLRYFEYVSCSSFPTDNMIFFGDPLIGVRQTKRRSIFIYCTNGIKHGICFLLGDWANIVANPVLVYCEVVIIGLITNPSLFAGSATLSSDDVWCLIQTLPCCSNGSCCFRILNVRVFCIILIFDSIVQVPAPQGILFISTRHIIRFTF